MKVSAGQELVVAEGAFYGPAQLAENAARQLYTRPDTTEQIVNGLDRRYNLYCGAVGLDRADPTVIHRRNRMMMKAISAPLFHEAELGSCRRYLGAYTKDGLDIQKYFEGVPRIETSGFPFEGAYADYVAIESGIDTMMHTQVADEVSGDDSHALYPIWDAYADIVPIFAKSEMEVRGHVRPSEPRQMFIEVGNTLAEDTMLPYMMQAALFFIHGRWRPPDRSIEAALLAKSEQLSWGSTGSRNTRLQSFPAAGVAEGTTPECPYKRTKPSPFNIGTTYDVLWKRPDLIAGPREASSFCPLGSNMELSSRSEADASTVEGVLATRGGQTIYKRERGETAGAELHLIRSIKLLCKTVFLKRYI